MPKRFSASSAAQLMACPGSANLELAIPGWKAPVRDDAAGAKGVGTRLHEQLQQLPYLNEDTLVLIGTALFALSRLHYTKRWPLCEDESEMEVWLWTNHSINSRWVDWFCAFREFTPKLLMFSAKSCLKLRDIKARLDGQLYQITTEETMIAEWLPSKPGTTPDVMFVGPKVLETIDFKSGKIPVHPEDNYQGMFYVASKKHLATQAREFGIHIFQPDNFGSWMAPISELEKWMLLAIETDEKIINKDLTLVPNDHCTFCPANPWSRGDKARPYCPEQLSVLYPPIVDENEILNM